MREGDTYVDVRESVEAGSTIYLHPDEFGNTIPGPGVLRDFYAVSGSQNYSVTVSTDTATVIDGSWDELQTRSPEINVLDAYVDNSEHIVTTKEIPFTGYSMVRIDPMEEITFKSLRGQWELR